MTTPCCPLPTAADGSGFGGGERLLQPGPGEKVIAALPAAAVRVLGAGKAAAGEAKLLQGIVQGAAGDFPEAGAPCLGVGFQVGNGQQGVVIEHLFKPFARPSHPCRVMLSENYMVGGHDQAYPLVNGVELPLRHALFDQDAIILKDFERTVTREGRLTQGSRHT